MSNLSKLILKTDDYNYMNCPKWCFLPFSASIILRVYASGKETGVSKPEFVPILCQRKAAKERRFRCLRMQN